MFLELFDQLAASLGSGERPADWEKYVQIYLRRHPRHLALAVLALALAACGPAPAAPPAPQGSPYADVQFELVDELCNLLDHNRLTDLAGSVVTTDERPARLDVERRMCTVFATTPEKTSLAYLRIGTNLRSPEDEEKEEDIASPSKARWSPVPGVGDSAEFQYVAHDELIDSPILNRPVRSLNAWLITHAGNATIALHLMLYADIKFDRGEIEELLSEYTREALKLMAP
ncbi:MAG TPA: hypothetical protein VFX60_12155 [Micromonospora sp.]|nr:hypothetical protein [Micromonospora sp.]